MIYTDFFLVKRIFFIELVAIWNLLRADFISRNLFHVNDSLY